MEKKKIGVAVLGTGGRSCGVVGNLLRDSGDGVKILAAYDPDTKEMAKAVGGWKHSGITKECASVDEAIRTPGVEWVMVFSPNAFHREQVVAAFEAGKNVFSEKPLATTIEDCRKIYEAHQKSGKLFATGFVLRYAPIYRKAKELLDSGRLGKLIAIDGDENIAPAHGGYIMCNWRRLTKYAGPHILEKCCHDLDLINWFTGSLPSRVASFGGRNFFLPENEPLMEKYGRKTFCSWPDPHAIPSPFSGDTDLMDNSISIAEFRNRVRVSFMATMSNAIPERRLYFSCSEGTMKLELYAGKLQYRVLGGEGTVEVALSGDGHGGGDDYIMKELYDSMTTGVRPKCGGNEGLESAVYALALDKSARTGQIVDLEPVWKSLER